MGMGATGGGWWRRAGKGQEWGGEGEAGRVDKKEWGGEGETGGGQWGGDWEGEMEREQLEGGDGEGAMGRGRQEGGRGKGEGEKKGQEEWVFYSGYDGMLGWT